MAYRKLGVDNKHRRSMLATLTKQVIMNEQITTTETRAKEVRKMVDKMITYGKKGSLGDRRRALAFVHNDKEVVNKVFNELVPRYQNRNGGYTQILKLQERRGDGALMVILKLIDVYLNNLNYKKYKKDFKYLKYYICMRILTPINILLMDIDDKISILMLMILCYDKINDLETLERFVGDINGNV